MAKDDKEFQALVVEALNHIMGHLEIAKKSPQEAQFYRGWLARAQAVLSR